MTKRILLFLFGVMSFIVVHSQQSDSVLKDSLEQDVLINPSAEVGKTGSTLTDLNSINVGLILPFRNKSDAQTARFVEYYEGFLLALEELKSQGFTANVYVFDMGSETGTAKLTSLLDTYEMKSLDLLIGGISPEQIAIMAEFAKNQGIKYVVPFPTKSDETENNPFVFQVNTPYSILYKAVARSFVNLFSGANVIFVSDNDTANEKTEFVSALTSELTEKGMTSKIVQTGQNLKDDLLLNIDKTRKNIVVATSGSSQMLQALMSGLKALLLDQSEVELTLFGHPEWQSQQNQNYVSSFGKYDTHIYSQLHFSQDDARVKEFIDNYSIWYNDKTMIKTFPRYGLLGYDTGIYFFSMLNAYGRDFQTQVSSMSYPTLQSSIILKKTNDASGYINSGFYLIHFKPDSTIEKTEYAK